jgi:hypothetical protein
VRRRPACCSRQGRPRRPGTASGLAVCCVGRRCSRKAPACGVPAPERRRGSPGAGHPPTLACGSVDGGCRRSRRGGNGFSRMGALGRTPHPGPLRGPVPLPASGARAVAKAGRGQSQKRGEGSRKSGARAVAKAGRAVAGAGRGQSQERGGAAFPSPCLRGEGARRADEGPAQPASTGNLPSQPCPSPPPRSVARIPGRRNAAC